MSSQNEPVEFIQVNGNQIGMKVRLAGRVLDIDLSGHTDEDGNTIFCIRPNLPEKSTVCFRAALEEDHLEPLLLYPEKGQGSDYSVQATHGNLLYPHGHPERVDTPSVYTVEFEDFMDGSDAIEIVTDSKEKARTEGASIYPGRTIKKVYFRQALV